MLTITDFTTNHENLVNLLSVATYGNYWPVVRVFKSDNVKGLFNDCDCREDKWAKALMEGKGVVVYDNYEMDSELNEGETPTKHYLTMDNVRKGLELMRDEYPHHYADLMEEEDDAITGDVWLQLAVFGEVIYG